MLCITALIVCSRVAARNLYSLRVVQAVATNMNGLGGASSLVDKMKGTAGGPTAQAGNGPPSNKSGPGSGGGGGPGSRPHSVGPAASQSRADQVKAIVTSSQILWGLAVCGPISGPVICDQVL